MQSIITVIKLFPNNIILMSYFLDMTDKQIGELLNLLRSTVTYQRHSALEMLKKFMEEMTDDEGK